MAKACLNKKSFSRNDRQYRSVFRQFIWSMQPQYMITLNFNYPNDVSKQLGRKYRNQKPRAGWLKHVDAVLNRRLIQRRMSRLPADHRVSLLPFAEFTTTDNLHFHMLLALPSRHRYSDKGLTEAQIQFIVSAITGGTLAKFFKGASIKVKAIWSKGAVNYVTKCVHPSSEIDWTFWHKSPAPHEAKRLNTFSNHHTLGRHHDKSAAAFVPRVRHTVESGSSIPSAIGVDQSKRVHRHQQTVRTDDPPAPKLAAVDPPTGNSARRFSVRGYSYRTVIAAVIAMARGWFTMPKRISQQGLDGGKYDFRETKSVS